MYDAFLIQVAIVITTFLFLIINVMSPRDNFLRASSYIALVMLIFTLIAMTMQNIILLWQWMVAI